MYGREIGFTSDLIKESDLKLCDLCGALNLVQNPECFACGWHGHFNLQAELVHVAIDLHCRQKGVLTLEDVTGGKSLPPLESNTFWGRFVHSLRRAWMAVFG